MNHFHLCFKCRFSWLSESGDKTSSPNCHSDSTIVTDDLAFVKSHIFREYFPDILVRVMEDPDLSKKNKPFMKEYWKHKK